MVDSKPSQTKRDRLWTEAKRRCRLNRKDVRMAKELGLNHRSLIKNISSPSQQWKLPVKQWIHELYEKRTEKAPVRRHRYVQPHRHNPHSSDNLTPLPANADERELTDNGYPTPQTAGCL